MKSRSKAEYGDFQTPADLAILACSRLSSIRPRSVIEPTCGKGSFVQAAARAFPRAERVLGYDINPDYLHEAQTAFADLDTRISLSRADFFSFDWTKVVRCEDGPWLIIGNPPWVTSSELGSLASSNLPQKSNFQGHKGFDAITGKANFDISEWMLLQYLEWLDNRPGAIAVLCKTAVARKVLAQAWSSRRPVSNCSIYKINALAAFGAAVDACFFVLEIGSRTTRHACYVYDDLKADHHSQIIGYDGKHLISDLDLHERTKRFGGTDAKHVWRSGIKHDCSKVMELRYAGNGLVNGFGEEVDVEEGILLPMLKSSDVGNGRIAPRGEMIITQRFVGQDTSTLEKDFPKAWRYLNNHIAALERRGSSIYKSNPKFSIFGVGGYSFSPWKVAISGFYKKLDFSIIPPIGERPIVFDDTVYFLPCSDHHEAFFVHSLLTSDPAQEFFRSVIHWDEKRPITVGLLKRLSLRHVAEELGELENYNKLHGSLAFARS